ncbi:unnamed protein product [Nezara viridula]|uniref:Uncharacterized protein n=1 Tax=Nezara viridula TaxID=85310 RepID=A0A9P0MXH9_NEZVI|nr:unnamed protein product [Nezara viridula]
MWLEYDVMKHATTFSDPVALMPSTLVSFANKRTTPPPPSLFAENTSASLAHQRAAAVVSEEYTLVTIGSQVPGSLCAWDTLGSEGTGSENLLLKRVENAKQSIKVIN